MTRVSSDANHDAAPPVEAAQQTPQQQGKPTPTCPQRLPAMERLQVLRELNTMVAARLFGLRQWLADSESVDALNRRLAEMGLHELVPGEMRETRRSTPFGLEQQLRLLRVFMGLIDEWDMPHILQDYELLDEATSESIWHLMGAGVDPERLLRPVVQKAYFEFYNRSGLWN